MSRMHIVWHKYIGKIGCGAGVRTHELSDTTIAPGAFRRAGRQRGARETLRRGAPEFTPYRGPGNDCADRSNDTGIQALRPDSGES
jgi:hypothetical protein